MRFHALFVFVIASTSFTYRDLLGDEADDDLQTDVSDFIQTAAAPAAVSGSAFLQTSQTLGVQTPSWSSGVAALFERAEDKWPVLDKQNQVSAAMLLLPVVIGFGFLVIIMFSFVDCSGRKKEKEASDMPAGSIPREVADEDSSDSSSSQELKKWSTKAIFGLTSYRFYTGFLNSTWMPFLLAMEGQMLMNSRQSFFMGTAKLIYGMSILMNPLFGLVGDQSASVSKWNGRSVFILVGVAVSGLGIYGCLASAHMTLGTWYLVATVLWMLGEALVDVTTETLVPELLPPSQYEIASSIRALNQMFGGLSGYAMIIAMRHYHYNWIYYTYLILMTVCASMTFFFISTSSATSRPRDSRPKPFSVMMTRAYIMPTTIEGGFPAACLSQFVFSLGSAPMFFFLLMCRDIVGIDDASELQTHFSCISMLFFVSAAVSASMGAISTYLADGQPEPSDSRPATAGVSEATKKRWQWMVYSSVLFGVVCAAIPADGLLGSYSSRIIGMYLLGGVFGFSFGAVYARFQDCTWSVLPAGADIANLMGFASMCKMGGIGLGNFVAGMILDRFIQPGGESGTLTYQLQGYFFMCLCCSFVVCISAAITWGVGKTAMATELAALSAKADASSSGSTANPPVGYTPSY